MKKKNGFLTFCFSCFPGAGQMFLGFNKEGVSLMGSFFLLLALSSWLQLDAIVFLLPVIWFYAFFDAMNKNSLSDEEFQKLEDHYLFGSLEELRSIPFARYRVGIALVLILLGAKLFMNNIFSILEQSGFQIPYEVYRVVFDYVPQLLIAILIIAAGIYLIAGKKSSLEKNGIEEETMDFTDSSDENQGGGAV